MREDPRTDSEVILCQTEDGKSRLQVRFSGETAWLSLNQLADLFQRDKSVISKHIKNIFEEAELNPEATVAQFAKVQVGADRPISREIEFYNLDVIISVGYRVKSHRGAQFRIWATQRLREYIVKSFALDDERLKQCGGGNYLDKLLHQLITTQIRVDHLDLKGLLPQAVPEFGYSLLPKLQQPAAEMERTP